MGLPRRHTAAARRSRPRGRRVDFRHRLSNAADISLGAKFAALTAAGTRVESENQRTMRRLVQPRQILALAYYDQVGEAHAAADFYGRNLKKVRLFAGERDGDGEIYETDFEPARQMVARIQDPGGGGYSQLLSRYGVIKFLTGEGYYLITNPEGDAERWEFVSPDELRINAAGGKDAYTRFVAPSLPAEELEDIPDDSFEPIGDQALVYRIWRPHPRFSRLADSAMFAQLKTLEELQLLSLAIGATAKNRMAVNGILAIAESVIDENIDADADEDPDHQEFFRQFTQQIVSPITNPGSAAAAAPVIVSVPDDIVETALKWVQISDPSQSYPEEGIRTELIRRFAVGVDLPASALTGVEDLNHWTGWLVDEQGARDYVFPVCQELVDELTAIFMRPGLKAQSVTDFDKYVIGFDAAAVIAHPNQAADAKDAHDRIVISDAAYRDSLNFSDDDAPSQEEWDRRAALKMLDPVALSIPYQPGDVDASQDEQREGVEGAPQGSEDTDQGPARSDRPTEAQPPEPAALRAAQIAGACRLAVFRSRELAGAKLRRAVNGNAPAETKDVSNDQLAAALGQEWVRANAGAAELALVAGGTRILATSLRGFEVTDDLAEQIAGHVAAFAAGSLYRSDVGQLPKGLLALIDQAVRPVS